MSAGQKAELIVTSVAALCAFVGVLMLAIYSEHRWGVLIGMTVTGVLSARSVWRRMTSRDDVGSQP